MKIQAENPAAAEMPVGKKRAASRLSPPPDGIHEAHFPREIGDLATEIEASQACVATTREGKRIRKWKE